MSVGAMGKAEPELIRVVKPEKRSLLEKYDIPVEHLSYEYISECTNSKILERILLVLRSGEEGVYPDLTRHTEERLVVIKPNSTILRKAEPILRRSMLEPGELKQIDNDINTWTSEMQFRENDLRDGLSTIMNEPLPLPSIRQIKEEISQKKLVNDKKNTDKGKRISSFDYAAWDKYDVDTELNKIEIREEQRTVELKRAQQRQKELKERKRAAENIIINRTSLTGTELDIMAEQAREKGNEAFRAGDYEEALANYDSSIKINSSLVTYNNRAMTLIKLHRYKDALHDCNVVLRVENANVKALLRRAVALEHLEKSVEALADYETVLQLEPTNKIAIAGVKKLRKPCESRKVRMTIEEVNDAEEESMDGKTVNQPEGNCNYEGQMRDVKQCVCFCDRAPGPSQNVKPRPHFKTDYCLESPSRQCPTNKIEVAYNVEEQKTEHKDVLLNNETAVDRKYHNYTPNLLADTNSALWSNKPKSIFSYSTPTKSIISTEESSAKQFISEPQSVVNDKSFEVIATKSECNGKTGNDSKSCNNGKHDSSKQSDNAKPETCKSENYRVKLSFSNKIQVADKYQHKTRKPKKDSFVTIGNINSPYEFTRIWQSLKDATDLKVHAQVLRSLNSNDLNTVIGNKLDGKMFSTIVDCLKRHFCTPDDAKYLSNFLKSLSQVNRFSIVTMLSNADDKKALRAIFSFLEDQGTPDVSLLQEVYCIS